MTGDEAQQRVNRVMDLPKKNGHLNNENGSHGEITPQFPHLWHSSMRTLEDAFKPREPIQYIVHGIFQRPSLNISYGAPGDLKTMLMLDRSLCIAANIPWLPTLPGKFGCGNFQVAHCPVVWIDFDMGRLLEDAIEALARGHGINPADVPFYYYSFPVPQLDAGDFKMIASLAEVIADHRAGSVVIDNLGIIKGKANENTDEMIPVMSNLKWLSENCDIDLDVIHHQTKGNSIQASTRAGDRLRGHSSIEASLSLALHVSREEGGDTVHIKSTKHRGAPIAPFSAVFTYTHKPDTHDLETARFFAVPEEGSDLLDSCVKSTLASGEKNKTTLVNDTKMQLPKFGINAIRARVDWLADHGEIKQRIGKRTEIIYYL